MKAIELATLLATAAIMAIGAILGIMLLVG